ITIDGGQLVEAADKQGAASLTARMMNYGTKNKTPQELEEAIQQLGANINISGSKESITISGNTLARNYDATLALVEEMLLEPRWDEKEFELTKQSAVNQIRQMAGNPNMIAQTEFNKLTYGKDNVFAKNNTGTVESVNAITLADLKAFYEKNISPSVARMHIVGDISKSRVTSSLKGLNTKWKKKDVKLPTFKVPAAPSKAQIYFYDVPNAAQSVLRIGYPALTATDAGFYPAVVSNYILGGGGFASRLTQELREGKGYTYGINSNFSGSSNSGLFTIGSGVRSNVTLESLQLIKEILEAYPKTFTAEDLETTKGFLVKSNARAFETAGAKLGMLDNISGYGWKPDYVRSRESMVKAMTLEQIRTLSAKHFDPNKMIWLVVGDAKTQLPRLKELGFGEPLLLNK
ncbi:MAG: insulinase family protein, partial [Acidobacteria bacterium]|nr:insulinase family protein [Acidobacteriota bacterium]